MLMPGSQTDTTTGGRGPSRNGVSSEQRGKWLEKAASQFEPDPQYLIPLLQYVQREAGYLPAEAMQAVARHLRMPESKVYGVASFYAQFYFTPRGRNVITVCRGTACHVRGSARLVAELEESLEVKSGGTTADLEFTVEEVSCVGACALAPVVLINGRVHRQQTRSSLKRLLRDVPSATPDAKATKAKPRAKAKHINGGTDR